MPMKTGLGVPKPKDSFP